jgi:L-iditol 2-dehydrogenase
MKVVLLTNVATLEVREREVPRIDDHSILLQVKAVGVCGSDLRIYRHRDPRVQFPRVMGHEISGVVAEVGKCVEGFEPGDRVALGAHIPCGTCWYCWEGQGQHCVKGWTIGYQFDGGFSEYTVLNRKTLQNGSICKFNEDVSFEQASLSEPFSCVLNGLKRLSVRPGETVAVFGAGAIGAMFISALRRFGAGKIIALQRSESRRKLAVKMGAHIAIDPAAGNAAEQILALTDGYGCDVCIVTAPSVEVQQQALMAARKQGRILFFAGLPGTSVKELDTNQIVYKELSVFGVHGASRQDHQDAMKWISQQWIDFSAFITHRYTLDDTEEAFLTTEKKSGLKSVIVFE